MSSIYRPIEISDSTVSSSDDHCVANMSYGSGSCATSESCVSSSDELCTEIIPALRVDGGELVSSSEPMAALDQPPERDFAVLAAKYTHETNIIYLSAMLEHMLECPGCEQPMCLRMRHLWLHSLNCTVCELNCGIQLFIVKLAIFHQVGCNVWWCPKCNYFTLLMMQSNQRLANQQRS